MMSRFWQKFIYFCPPFNGTAEQMNENFDSHIWSVVDLAERFGYKGLGKVSECRVCEIIASSEQAKYECGKAPEEVTLDEWQRRNK